MHSGGEEELIDVDHEDNSLRTFILFVQTADAVSKYTNAQLHKKAGLSSIKFIVLNVLKTNGGNMTPSEIANLTGFHHNSVLYWIRQGQLKATRLKSGYYRVRREDLERFKEEYYE